jgi:hypothetical protein
MFVEHDSESGSTVDAFCMPNLTRGRKTRISAVGDYQRPTTTAPDFDGDI